MTPVLTVVACIIAIIATIIFRVSCARVQFLPRYWARIISRLAGMRVTLRGGENLTAGQPHILAANHQSQFDIFALQGYLNIDFRWLAKKELFEIPVFGLGMRQAGYIPIDRSRGREAIKSLYAAAERIAAGASVIIFPEGTRSPNGKLQEFKTGGMVLAIKSGVPIVPVAICGTHDILPKGKLLARPGRVTINVGRPIATSNFKVSDKQELARRLHDEVAALMEKGQA
ncbi:MAG TPA: 1-acyl-sn-glycerol-3-phosphate acyltransferase [Desulfobacterales bacterium]|nr:1-acyl-sn-glycerol-3-phosphate acyltransferase [Desulfobacterales bacterium]